VTADAHLRAWLAELGLDRDPEMAQTAERMTAFARTFADPGPPPSLSVCASTGDDPVRIGGLPFYSLCAHHWLPFFGTVDISYVPSGRLAGLGAFADALAWCARRPQLQERLTAELADLLMDGLSPTGVRVVTRARHLCLEMRHPAAGSEVVAEAVRGDGRRLA
jgi:GTP cyclohydrolase IA